MDKETSDKLYSMKLHSSLDISGISILRVPGGWIYDYWNFETDCPKQGIFVPFNNEFHSKPDTIK